MQTFGGGNGLVAREPVRFDHDEIQCIAADVGHGDLDGVAVGDERGGHVEIPQRDLLGVVRCIRREGHRCAGRKRDRDRPRGIQQVIVYDGLAVVTGRDAVKLEALRQRNAERGNRAVRREKGDVAVRGVARDGGDGGAHALLPVSGVDEHAQGQHEDRCQRQDAGKSARRARLRRHVGVDRRRGQKVRAEAPERRLGIRVRDCCVRAGEQGFRRREQRRGVLLPAEQLPERLRRHAVEGGA